MWLKSNDTTTGNPVAETRFVLALFLVIILYLQNTILVLGLCCTLTLKRLYFLQCTNRMANSSWDEYFFTKDLKVDCSIADGNVDEKSAMWVTQNQSSYCQMQTRPRKKKSVCMLHLEALKGKRCMEACRISWLLFLEAELCADTAAQALMVVGRKGMLQVGDCPFWEHSTLNWFKQVCTLILDQEQFISCLEACPFRI